jgi:hypothetical protein
LSVSAGALTIEISKGGYASVTKQVTMLDTTRILDVEIAPLPSVVSRKYLYNYA